jgi:hypothetical protein
MNSLALIVGFLALLGFIGWLLYEQRVERERLINRLIAKTASEVRVLDNEPRHPAQPTVSPRDMSPEDRDFWADFEGPVGI